MLNFFRKIFYRSNINCQEVRQLSSDYIEGELAPAKLSSIRSHLTWCGPCRAFVDTLAATIGALARLPRIAAPLSFKQSILERTQGLSEGETSGAET